MRALLLSVPTSRYALVVGLCMTMVGFGVVMIRTDDRVVGLGWNNDAQHIIATAWQLRHGNGLVGNDLEPASSIIPPGVQMAIAAISLVTSTDVLTAIRILNGLSIGLVVFSSALLLYRLVATRLALLLGTVAVLTTPTLLQWSVAVMTDVPFLAAFLLVVYWATGCSDRMAAGGPPAV